MIYPPTAFVSTPKRLCIALLLAVATSASACASRTTEVRFDEQVVHTLRLSYNNAHLLIRGNHAVLIDAGLEKDAPELDAAIRAAGVDPAKLRAIIITHGHADHAGGAGWFKRRYKTQIIAGAGDKKLLATGHNDKLCPTDSQARGRLAEDQNATYTPLAADKWIATTANLASVVTRPDRWSSSLEKPPSWGICSAVRSWGSDRRPTSTCVIWLITVATSKRCSPALPRRRARISSATLVQ